MLCHTFKDKTLLHKKCLLLPEDQSDFNKDGFLFLDLRQADSNTRWEQVEQAVWFRRVALFLPTIMIQEFHLTVTQQNPDISDHPKYFVLGLGLDIYIETQVICLFST